MNNTTLVPVRGRLGRALLAPALLTAALVVGIPPDLPAQQAPVPVAPAAPNPDSSSQADKNVQELASYLVTSTTEKPFENGANLDIPRTSNDIQPYTIINRAAIDQSDYSSLSSFLQNELTQDTVSQQYNQGAGGNGGASSGSSSLTAGGHVAGLGSVNLRGLGTLQTLVLINGARIATESFANAEVPSNIDQIPLSAIDHIEVLPSSASAIYGSSAVGGVINVVLKKDYTGGEIDATYGNTFNTDNSHRTYQFNVGFSIGDKTHISIMGGYDEAKTPELQDRTFLTDRIARVLHNNPALVEDAGLFTLGATPNITLDTGAAVNGYTNPTSTSLTLKNGTSLNSLYTYIPPGTSPATPAATLAAGLLANAGHQNFNLAPGDYNGGQQQIEPFPRNESFMVQLDHEFTDRFEVYADFGLTEMKLISFWNGGNNNTAGLDEEVPVAGSAANNPFQQNVFVSVPLPASQGELVENTNLDRYGLLGFLLHLPHEWETVGEFALTEARYENFYQQLDLSPVATGSGLLGASSQLVQNGVLNLFTDTVANSQNYSSYTGSNYEWFPSSLADFNLRASGPVFELPAGSPKLTIGIEDRFDQLHQGLFLYTQPPLPNTTQTTPFSLTRDIYPGSQQSIQAGYLEAEIPVIAAKNRVPFVNDLELQLAARTENFNANGDAPYNTVTAPTRRQWAKYSSTNPTFGLKYKPVESMTFRASYAEGFVPPTASQLEENTTAAATTTPIFFDPKLNQSYQATQVSLGGNPNLKPQSSKAWDLGFIWEPDFEALKGLRVNLEYYNIHEYNVIQSPALQLIVDTPSLQNNVIRNSSGMITEVLLQNLNVAQEYTDGFDLSADYRKTTPIGGFNLHAAATVIEHLKEPPAPGDPLVEYVGYVNSGGVDKFKANATLTYLLGRNWTFGWNTIYYAGYKQSGAPGDPEYGGASSYTPITLYTLAQGGNSVASQVYHDIFVSYRFGTTPFLHHLMDRTTLQVGINDLFNSAPPFDSYIGGGAVGIMFYSPYGDPLLRNYVLKIKKEF